MSQQFDLFALPARINPFAKVQGVNMFGTRAVFIGCWTCTGSDLVRLGYAGS